MANTPFLDLVKPAGTDHALVSVINSNSDKIDRGFGTLSEQIGNLNISAISSSTTIASLCSSCPAGQHRYYFIADSNTLTDYPSTTRMYRVLLSIHKIDGSNNRADIELMGKNGSDIPLAFIGVYENGTQYWSQLATKSDIGALLVSDSITPSSSFPISATGLSKYNIFSAVMVSSWQSGPAFGVRISTTAIRFMGFNKNTSGISQSFISLNVSGDSITGIDSSSVWGTSATGISTIRGIC